MIKLLLSKQWAYVILVSMVISILSAGCKKDNDPAPSPYSNPNDDTTSSIKLTIPRIELSALKSTQVKLYLSVTDQSGNPLKEFNKFNFEIKQVCAGNTDTTLNGTITIKKINIEGSNIASALTMDYSGSMGSDDISNMEDAVNYFISLKENNDFMQIIKFGSQVEVMADFTNDENELINAVDNLDYSGSANTAFYDAVDMGLTDGNEFYGLHNNVLPAVIGFTDGKDNRSNISLSALVEKAQSFQIPIYTIGFGSPDTDVMNYIADETGGRYYYTPNAAELVNLYSLINGQLKNLYIGSWNYDNPECDEVIIIVKVYYTCNQGTLVSTATKQFSPL